MRTHEHLLAQLGNAGQVPTGWADAFAAVDRAAFIPRRCWCDGPDGYPQPLDRDTEPNRWCAAVYSDEPIMIQLDWGRTAWPATSPVVTSSASQPSIVLSMLGALDAQPGRRVLEIGTGAGYNAALLTHRLGEQQVTSVEIDPVLAGQARSALVAADYQPAVSYGDGAEGWAEGAPYDRIIATAAVVAGRLPYAWVTQTRPGGLILTPWGTAYRNGVLVRLTVGADETATGPIIGDAAFMRLRDQDTPFGHAVRLADLVSESTIATETSTAVPPSEVAISPDGAFSVGLHLPDVQRSVAYDDEQTYEVLLYHVPSESAVTVQVTPDATATAEYLVRQHGPRRLWDEAEAAHTWWTAYGRPARTRYGLTVTPDHQHIWLDQPSNLVMKGSAPVDNP